MLNRYPVKSQLQKDYIINSVRYSVFIFIFLRQRRADSLTDFDADNIKCYMETGYRGTLR
jgi:hypothetical protein